MKRIAKWIVVGIVAVLVLMTALVLQTIYFKPLRIDWFYSRVFAMYALDNPELLSGLRVLPSWLLRMLDSSNTTAPNAAASNRSTIS